MNHQTNSILSASLCCCGSFVCALFETHPHIGSIDFETGVAPISALLCCCVFYSLALALRTRWPSPAMSGKWTQTGIASSISAAVLTFPFLIRLVLIAAALFLAARLIVPDTLIDEETARRKHQILGEFGLDVKS